MAFTWPRPTPSIAWLWVLGCFSLDVCLANVNSSTSATPASVPAQCHSATGLKKFILPIIDKGHRLPEEHLPYGVMVDLFFRSHYDPSAKAIFGEPEAYYTFPNLDPCLRVDVKLVFDNDSARDTFINSGPYFHWESQDNQDLERTHTAMYSADNEIHSFSGMEADGLGIVTVSPNIMPVVGDEELFPNFFRASSSELYQMQPIWGFFKMYDWKAVMIVYSTDARMVAMYEAFMDNAAKDSVPQRRIRNSPLPMLMPPPTTAIEGALISLRVLPIRVIFHFVAFGVQHKAMQGISFLDQIIKIQMEIGLWLPTPESSTAYQIVSGSDFVKADLFQNVSVRAVIGTRSYGSFFFSESHLKEPSMLAARWSARSWWLGKAGQLGAVDLNMHHVKERYGLNEWPSSILQPVLERFNEEKGLPGLILSMLAEDVDASWLKADMAMKQMMAHNCFLQKGGNLNKRDARLFGDCLRLVSQDKKLFTFEEAFDVDRMMEDIHHLFGPVQVLDPTTNMSVAFWWNPVVRSEVGRGPDRLRNGYSRAGRCTGHETPVWGNGAQSDDPPEMILNCTPGMRLQRSGGLCVWCQAGRYSSGVDAEECVMCPKGRFASIVGATICHACAPGSEARDSGSQGCDSCKPGSYSNRAASTSCATCQIGAFSDGLGATACKNCAAGYTTGHIAAEDVSECVCPRGEFLTADNECVKCMEGLACADGWPRNWATKGGTAVLKRDFYSLESAPYETYRCQQKGSEVDHPRCPGGPPEHCGDGLDKDTLVCTKCSKSGYHVVNGRCAECPAYLQLLPLFMVIASISLIVMFFYVNNAPLAVNAQHRQDFTIFVGLTITILQLFGVLTQLQVQWPTNMGSILGSSSSLLSFQFSFACTVGDGAVAQYFAQAIIPHFLIAMTAALGVTSRILARALEKERMAWSFSKCLNVVGQVLQALFIAFCDIMVRPIRCYDHPNGKQSVVVFPEVVCWESDDHSILAMIAAGIFLLFIVPYVSWCIWGCVKAPEKSSQRDTAFLETFRFLFYRFRPDRWWWGLVFLVRQTCLGFAAVVASSNPHAQLFYTGGILMVYAYFLAMFWPWISTELTMVDLGTCLVLERILMCSTQLLPTAPEGGRVSILVVLLMVLGFMVFRYLLILTISLCSNGLDSEICGETPNRLQLCENWFEFLETMQRESKNTTIETICKMNTFDRARILAVMHTWTAQGNIKLSEKLFHGKKTPPRLSNIRSRTVFHHASVRSNGGSRALAIADSSGKARMEQKIIEQRS